jgi:membrane-associated protein
VFALAAIATAVFSLDATVVLARWVAFLRSVMPALAGAARMPYRRFLVINAAGVSPGAPWWCLPVCGGHIVRQAERTFGRGPALVVVGIAVLAVLVAEIRHHRRQPSSNVSS